MAELVYGGAKEVDARTITSERIDELTEFVPLFETDGRTFVSEWVAGEREPGGVLIMPFPIYTDDVLSFFCLAGQSWWCDYDYVPAKAAEMLGDDAFIEQASLADVKSMLTYCVRGERFCDGHWAAVLESGRILALLRRLVVLRSAMEALEEAC